MDEKRNQAAPEAEEELTGPELLTLEDGVGNEITFEIIASLEHEGERYVGVVEYIEDPDQITGEEQLVILHVGTDEEGDYFDLVEDDEELYQVGKKIEALLQDEYDIEM